LFLLTKNGRNDLWFDLIIFISRFEEKHGFISGARKVYERAAEFFGDEQLDDKLFLAFAKFEEGQREVSWC